MISMSIEKSEIIKNKDLEGIEGLVNSHGSGFHRTSWLNAFEVSWPGDFKPYHFIFKKDNRVIGFIPAYIYRSCPRVDYYKKTSEKVDIEEEIIISHALVGWYGYPIIKEEKDECFKRIREHMSDKGLIIMFSGIDSRDEETIKSLKNNNFYISRFHTITSRCIDSRLEDPTSVLPKRRRDRVRNSLSKGKRAGIKTRLAKSSDMNTVVRLISGVLEKSKTNSNVLSKDYLDKILSSQIKGLEVVLGLDRNDDIIGAQINIHSQSTYYIWLAGHDYNKLNEYQTSHFLYECSIKRASLLGCTEIQAGRNPYDVKRKHGFFTIPLYCAILGGTNDQHENAVEWANKMEERHISKYNLEL